MTLRGILRLRLTLYPFRTIGVFCVFEKLNSIHSNVYGLVLIAMGALLVCLNQHDTGNSLIVGGGVLMNINLNKQA